ncbi:hypothetical protein FG93_04273 [Bosea sp. LC85]|uniref:hypothetical protein n=1 Tax=Bosea sp. LC85 TaxID=1502851 RepID=UPI0004E2D773|nr:hypothetical protein [Bosea sp. LC85]KFC66793.1 hypothetical protein FG93_04273 [Bosea sp. LC85]
MLKAIPWLGINGLEIACALLLLGLFGWFLRERAPTAPGWIALLIVTPVLFLTAAEGTQFLTMDEVGIFIRLFTADNRAMDQVMLGVFGASLPISLPLTRILEASGLSADAIRMLLKALWWLIGGGVAILIARLLLQFAGFSRQGSQVPLAFAFAGILTLPTVQLALKTFNYDIVSSGLGIVAVLMMLKAVAEGDAIWLKQAFIAAVIAAQEKLTAGPILLAAIIAIGVTRGAQEDRMTGRFVRAAISAATYVVIAMAIGLVLRALLWLSGPPVLPHFYWSTAVDAFSSWLWVPLKYLLPIETILAHRSVIALATAVLVSAAAGLIAIPASPASAWLRRLDTPPWFVYAAAALVPAFVFGLGTFGLLTVQGYWAPYHPRPVFDGVLLQELNLVTLHTGASSPTQHHLEIVLYALAVTVAAVPSVLWAAGAGGLVASGLALVTRRALDPALKPALVLSLLSLPLPILAALGGVPFAHRYFNLSLGLLACALILLGLALLRPMQRRIYGHLVTALFFLALLVEIAPFRPLFAAFRPLWLTYGDARKAEPGRLNPSWMGWGEDIMIAGKMLEAKCRSGAPELEGVACRDLTLHMMSSGLWPGRHAIKVLPLDSGKVLDSKADYYIVNRLYLIQNFFAVPPIEPDYRVSFRGYDLAWIYRGDRLGAAGYSFRKPGT